MILAIVAAEVAFWVVLLGGLVVRYVLRRPPLGGVLLAAVPLVDLVLLVVVSVDVARGAEATPAHALAALYLGVTVAFGRSVVERTDAWFRHRFAAGPRPSTPAKGSRAEVRGLWREWGRVVLAAVIAAAGLGLMIAVEGAVPPRSVEAAAQHPYWSTLLLLALITGICFLAGPAFAGRGHADGAPATGAGAAPGPDRCPGRPGSASPQPGTHVDGRTRGPRPGR